MIFRSEVNISTLKNDISQKKQKEVETQSTISRNPTEESLCETPSIPSELDSYDAFVDTIYNMNLQSVEKESEREKQITLLTLPHDITCHKHTCDEY